MAEVVDLGQAMELGAAGRWAEVRAACEGLLARTPGEVGAGRLLGRALRELGDLGGSFKVLQLLRSRSPMDPLTGGELGVTLLAAGMAREAMPLLEAACRALPGDGSWLGWLGRAQLQMADPHSAIKTFKRARELAPGVAWIDLELAQSYRVAGKSRDSEVLYLEILERTPNDTQAMTGLAMTLEHSGRSVEAEELYRRSLALEPSNLPTLAGLVRALRSQGRDEDARVLLAPVIERGTTAPMITAAYARLELNAGNAEGALRAVERSLAATQYPVPVESPLRFVQGDCLVKLKDHDRAFAAFKRGNDIQPRRYRAEDKRRYYDNLKKTFCRASMASMPRGRVDGSRALFIVGMPRSGTTLLEQILDGHPAVFGAGELTELSNIATDLAKELGEKRGGCFPGITEEQATRLGGRYLAYLRGLNAGAERVVDKLPHNFEMVGLIAVLLPGARVIHCRRTPMDNCLSCYVTGLSAAHTYATNLEDLGHAYGLYRSLMAHWTSEVDIPILDVVYEDMVADVEGGARRVLGFLGLPWHEGCLDFHRRERTVATASLDQVRKPIYTSSIGRWKHYEKQLEPLWRSLETAGVKPDDPRG